MRELPSDVTQTERALGAAIIGHVRHICSALRCNYGGALRFFQLLVCART